MFIVSGNNNESGSAPLTIQGVIEETEPDTLVSFEMPIEEHDPIENIAGAYSRHKNGYSYANYALYAITSEYARLNNNETDTREKLLMCKGKIFRTNVLFDMTENVINEQ